jgi:hypothetical protein
VLEEEVSREGSTIEVKEVSCTRVRVIAFAPVAIELQYSSSKRSVNSRAL